MPEQVILLRHGEKPAVGDTLSPQGFERAKALVGYFSQSTMPFQLKAPVAIFAQRSDKKKSSTRPVQTVGPLSNFWQVPLYTRYSSEEYDKLAEDISKNYTSGLVAVCWSHDNLAKLATELGVKDAPEWPGSDYASVWVINFSGNKVASFQQYLQNN